MDRVALVNYFDGTAAPHATRFMAVYRGRPELREGKWRYYDVTPSSVRRVTAVCHGRSEGVQPFSDGWLWVREDDHAS